MAENTIQTRIQLKYDTLTNWNSSTFILKAGEVAIAEVPSGTSDSGLNPPAIGIKFGNGTDRFSNLPWIQAAAGDVYSWAKAANKPSYSANEITGLSNYITTVAGEGKQYRIVKGNNVSDYYTYYLESKTASENEWTRDTTYVINLQSFDTRLSELESWADLDYSLGTQIGNIVTTRLSQLSLSDSAVQHQFVTAVSQTNGQISVTRSALSADDISDGTLPVSRGGTGLSTISSGEVLVGNGTGAITTKAIDSNVANNDHLITGAAVQAYVSSQMSGIANAMHFIGFTEDIITSGSSTVPTITGKTYTTPAAGDVVVSGNTEWVYNGSTWQELGTEGDYAVKGSITKNDLANALKNEINGKLDSTTAASTYVAQNGTDRLMTASEGTKLSGIEAGAEVNTIESISVNGVTQTIDANRNIDLTFSTPSNTVLGARVLNAAGTDYEDVTLDSTTQKLTFARIAKTGDVEDLVQTSGTILVLNCGTASTVI